MGEDATAGEVRLGLVAPSASGNSASFRGTAEAAVLDDLGGSGDCGKAKLDEAVWE